MDYCLEYQYLNDENHLYKEINIDELIDLLDSFYSGIVYIGGPWCPNCQAIIDLANNIAKKRGITEIYNLNTRFVNIYGEIEDLRDCKTLETKLKYYQIVEKLGFQSDELVKDTLISKMRVPFFLGMKHGICVGYFSAEYLRDGVLLHEEGSTEDKTIDFADELIDLITQTQEKNSIL